MVSEVKVGRAAALACELSASTYPAAYGSARRATSQYSFLANSARSRAKASAAVTGLLPKRWLKPIGGSENRAKGDGVAVGGAVTCASLQPVSNSAPQAAATAGSRARRRPVLRASVAASVGVGKDLVR